MDLRRGAYFVPNDELSDEQRNASSGEAFQQRYFTTVDFLLHRGLSSVQYASFFNKCRLNGLAFDMQDRLGTVRPASDAAPMPRRRRSIQRVCVFSSLLHLRACPACSVLVPGGCICLTAMCAQVFNLMDSFASGVLGIVSVGRSPYESFAELSEVLQFMNSALGSKGMEVETEDQGFKNIYATFKYLAERIRPAEALPQ